MIVDSTGELPVAVPHISDDEEDDKPFGGPAIREQKMINFNINVTSTHPQSLHKFSCYQMLCFLIL